MSDFSCSWKVQFLGSFALEKSSPNDVSNFLANLQSKSAQNCNLAVSLLGIRLKSGEKTLAAYSMRRVVSVIGRPGKRQVAYMTVEYTGNSSTKMLHVFNARSAREVDEIESVMDNAFQMASSRKSRILSSNKDHDDRKRKYVGKAFNNVINKLSASQTRMKRVTTAPTNRATLGPVHEEPTTSKAVEPTVKPIFDEKLEEWILPVNDAVKKQLASCSFFVEMPTREALVKNLLSRPHGCFVVRCSESKKSCLALSMRVPSAHNKSGVSHYLIIRSSLGFRLKNFKKQFASLQMLLTHYSVIQDDLPCKLVFTNWTAQDWKIASRLGAGSSKCRSLEKNFVQFQRYDVC